MTPTARFSLETHDGPYEDWPLRSRVLADGAPTTTKLSGYNLLHQFAVTSGYLLITDFDCPFEETTVFTLLDPALQILAKKSLGVPYGSFLLDRVEVKGPNELIVVLYDNDRWRLTIAPRQWLSGMRLSIRRLDNA